MQSKQPDSLDKTLMFDRVSLMLGQSFMKRISHANMIVFGMGGVGSWCAESLLRTGAEKLTIVDSDKICITNINRQLQATTATLDQIKTDAMKTRLLSINPHADIHAVNRHYDETTESEFNLNQYDYVVDAIDSLKNKARLLYHASQSRAQVFSAFGAACKLDPSQIRTDEFHDVRGCPLGSKLRKLMRRSNMLPQKAVTVVYSAEARSNACLANSTPITQEAPVSAKPVHGITHGSVAHITGMIGLTLAGLIVQNLQEQS